MSPLLIFHIGTASIALLGGVAAMSMRKGSTGHRTGGTVFVIGMICMTASAIPLGLLKTQTLNALVGALTCYLVASGWMAGRRDRFQDVRIVNAARTPPVAHEPGNGDWHHLGDPAPEPSRRTSHPF